jgi:hypothetical protein
MTFNDDPNINRQSVRVTERSTAGMWIAGAVAVCLVIGLVVFATTRTTNDTAMTEKPAATTTTTGSGAVTSGTDKPAQPAKPLPNEKAPAAPKQ